MRVHLELTLREAELVKRLLDETPQTTVTMVHLAKKLADAMHITQRVGEAQSNENA